MEEEEDRRRRVVRQASRWVSLSTYISRGTVLFCFGELDTPLTCESELTKTPTFFQKEEEEAVEEEDRRRRVERDSPFGKWAI